MLQNLGWATGYNLVAVPLAAGVLAWAGVTLAPAVGAVLMSASTIVVALNAQLLRRVDLRPTQRIGHHGGLDPNRLASAAALVWSGDAGVLGELIDVAVRGPEVDPGVAAVVDP